MSRRSVFAGLALVLGCTESTPNAARPPPKSAASASVAPVVQHPEVADAGEVVTIPESKPTWRSTPKETNGFYPVLDGLCSKLGMGSWCCRDGASRNPNCRRRTIEVVCGEPASTTREISLE